MIPKVCLKRSARWEGLAKPDAAAAVVMLSPWPTHLARAACAPMSGRPAVAMTEDILLIQDRRGYPRRLHGGLLGEPIQRATPLPDPTPHEAGRVLSSIVTRRRTSSSVATRALAKVRHTAACDWQGFIPVRARNHRWSSTVLCLLC